MAWIEAAQRALARHRRSRFARRLDRLLVRLHQGFENRDYNHDCNGEARVLAVLAAELRPLVVFDVGANVGEWAGLAARAFPDAQIHCFEPVTPSFEQLARAAARCPNVRANRVALSNDGGRFEIHYPPGHSILASAHKDFSASFHGKNLVSEIVQGRTGDDYCAEHGIERIDFLKVDVEGLEDRVLRGLAGMLGRGRVQVIQFEYGYVNIASKFLLKDFYDLLEPCGMRLGKVYPDHVDFRPYRHEHEDFLGPNYLAVHQSLGRLIESLNR